MNIANYLTAVNRAGELGHYPLSTETLAFIQEQIQLLASLAKLTGRGTHLLKSPSLTEPGVVIHQHEVLTIAPLTTPLTPGGYDIKVQETLEDITTADDLYKGARSVRCATLVPGSTLQANSRGELAVNFTDMKRLEKAITDLEQRSNERFTQELVYKDAFSFLPLFLSDLTALGERVVKRGVISNLPTEFPEGEQAVAPFTKFQQEILGGTLVTDFVDLSGEEEHRGFRQELTTREGVIYERYVFNPRAKSSGAYKLLTHWLKKSIPWRAKPGSIIGTLTLVPNGTWLRSGVFAYGSPSVASNTIFQLPDCHPLLQQGKCQIQVSISSSQSVALAQLAHARYTLGKDSAGFRIDLDNTARDNTYYVSVTAIALPTDEPEESSGDFEDGDDF